MTTESLPQIISLLAHDIRWQLVKSLTESDYRVNELVEIVDQPLNLVSYHLKKLRDDQLVTARRSEADGRDTYYSLDVEYLRKLYQMAGSVLHPSVGSFNTPSVYEALSHVGMTRVLFVCTHNSARSQMAEGLLRYLSRGRVQVSSGGSTPSHVHPEAVSTMSRMGIDIQLQTSKSFHLFLNQPFDYVITVCDLAREICPVFPADSPNREAARYLHWSFPDPAIIEDPKQRQQAFEETALRLKSRIEHFLSTLKREAEQ
jgi:ArsR family transcriptional regulator, arsenate/arsenite/antimonite-responsive transcriptional repressor / arsenate reductase (thioredoxin)